MGYRTEFSGSISYFLSDDKLITLKKELEKMGILDLFNISNDQMTVMNYWKNHGLFESVLLYLEQNGILHKGQFKLEGDNTLDKRIIKVEKGELIEYKYEFDAHKETIITLDKALSKLRFQLVVDYNIILSKSEKDLYNQIEEIIIKHMTGEEIFTQKKNQLFTILKESGSLIELKTPTFKVIINGNELDKVKHYPFQKNNGNPLKTIKFEENHF